MKGSTQNLKQQSTSQNNSQNRTQNHTRDETHTVCADEVTGEDTCGECGGDLVRPDSKKEAHCQDCGLVLEAKQIDRGPEWRAYNSKDKREKSRVGAPRTQLLHDKGLSTNISWKDKDGYGRSLSSDQRKRMKRLRKWNKRVRFDSSSHSTQFGIAEIRRMGSALGSPKQPKETAAMIFRQAKEKEVLIGRSIESVASASLYIALRKHSVPRTLDEVTMVSRAERKSIMRSKRNVARELGLETTVTSPLDYLPRYASKIGVPRELQNEAEQLIRDVEGTQVLGNGSRPGVLAACALYAASITQDMLLTQREIGHEVDITPVSIRNHYRKFLIESDRYPITDDDVQENTNPDELVELLYEHGELQ